MITKCKSGDTDNDPAEVPAINFLLVDGALVAEKPILFDNRYWVSAKDSNKYGKVEYYKDRTKYYLKQYRGGRPGELLVDPYGMYAKREDLSAYLTQRGHRFCEYIEVAPEVFESYMIYLHTRNHLNFRYAEKAVLDKVL